MTAADITHGLLRIAFYWIAFIGIILAFYAAAKYRR